MSVAQAVFGEIGSATVAQGIVLRVEDGQVLVAIDGDPEGAIITCLVLQSIDGGMLQLIPSDVVLLWSTSPNARRGIVLGRIGPSHAPSAAAELKEEVPDELVIEAKKNLTLKCGDGSITIREDGKILIKGKDLVSHAQRMNRIKGGSVSIN